MKQHKIMTAYKLLESLADNPHLTKQEQWGIYKLRVALRPHCEFETEQENIIREKYREFADENETLTGDKAKEFIAEMKSVGDLDVDVEEFVRPTIRMNDGITCKVIEPLEEFVEFLPPED